MNIDQNKNIYLRIFTSLLLAALLTSMPLPKFLHWLWPQWLLLVMMFWIINFPDRVGFGAAFGIGLLLDTLSGSMLGEHGLALIIITYFLIKFNNKIAFSRISAQSIMIFMLIFLYLALLYWIHGMIKNLPATPNYWLSSIISALIWPSISLLMRKWIKPYKPKYNA
jgi:rod shape-determining protein MreD